MAALLINSSCIHVSKEEVRSVQELPASNLTNVDMGTAQVSYLIYRTSQLPLEEFFSNLKKGEYKNAFQKIDIRYKSANFKDEALTKVIDEGFIPVYVKIKNTGASTLEFDEKSFSLMHEKGAEKAFYSEHLPRIFQEVNPNAIAANVYNTGVVVIGFAAVLGVLILAGADSIPSGPYGGGSGGGSTEFGEGPIYNDLQKNVRVDYKNYLITKSKLEPGQEAKGLLFFNFGKNSLAANSQLYFLKTGN